MLCFSALLCFALLCFAFFSPSPSFFSAPKSFPCPLVFRRCRACVPSRVSVGHAAGGHSLIDRPPACLSTRDSPHDCAPLFFRLSASPLLVAVDAAAAPPCSRSATQWHSVPRTGSVQWTRQRHSAPCTLYDDSSTLAQCHTAGSNSAVHAFQRRRLFHADVLLNVAGSGC